MCIYLCYNTVTIFPPSYMILCYKKMCYPYNKDSNKDLYNKDFINN